jgi:hypothetical protein
MRLKKADRRHIITAKIFTRNCAYTRSGYVAKIPLPTSLYTNNHVSSISIYADDSSSNSHLPKSTATVTSTSRVPVPTTTVTASTTTADAASAPTTTSSTPTTSATAANIATSTPTSSRPENSLHPILLLRSGQAPPRRRSTAPTTQSQRRTNASHGVLPPRACSTRRNV